VRVAVYYNNRDVRLEERPVPRIGPGELLMRTAACGICGSDVMEWYRVPKAPLVLGHEATGEVVAVGEGVEGFAVGDRIFVSHHVPCMTCRYCLAGHHSVCETLRRTNYDPGGFSEYIRVPAINVERGTYRLPPEMSYEDGVFIEPLACVVRGQRMAGLRPGQSVLVLGSGIAGLLHIQLACALGAGRVVATDLSEYRLAAAKRLGAEAVIHGREDVPRRLREVNEGRLADLVIASTGAPQALAQALRSVEPGGTILFFAPTEPGAEVSLPFNDLWRNEVTMTSTYAGSPMDILQALELLRAGRIRVREMITHRLPLAETGKGFEIVARAQDSIKVVVEPQR
jgi:L-iditol 2-dehydrogenase